MNAPTDMDIFLARKSFIELNARERCTAVLDAGTCREILGPFDRLKSPWLPLQNIVAQADDGVVIARGTIDGAPAVVAAIESSYQGGSMGEVSGAKIAGALECALRDNQNGIPTRMVLLLETGGVRLQEANLGLAAIAEIHAGIVALRRYVPVVGVVAGMVGCFGGMSLAAALCSYLIVTRQGRIGMNGPEVIEQEAGIAELDASDKTLIWSLIGGQQRARVGMVDTLVEDDAAQIAAQVRASFAMGIPKVHRSEDIARYLPQFAAIDSGNSAPAAEPQQKSASRGLVWLQALAEGGLDEPDDAENLAGSRSVLFSDGMLGADKARFIAVVPDPGNRFPRARNGEVGLEQGWSLAALVRRAIGRRDASGQLMPIVAVVDVVGQAYGRQEELMGIHIACAAAANAYADARLEGHPVIALIVGHAMSGAFLAHGYQANRIVALDAPGVLIHAMGQAAAARITRRSVEQLIELGERIAPMSYDVRNYAKLGLLEHLIEGVEADAPGVDDVERVRQVLIDTLASIRADDTRDMSARYRSKEAHETRAASIEVRKRLAQQWQEK
jgi:malonate decarboxylase beta subunit